MRRTILGALAAFLLTLGTLLTPVAASPVAPPAHETTFVTTDGLAPYDEGAAAYYSPSYDNGGWDRIIGIHIHDGQYADDGSFPYSPEGYYCVRPSFDFGNIITLQNPATGATIRCTVADSVAPQDQPNWWRHFRIELSWSAFSALSLGGNNDVELWVTPGSRS